MTNFNYFILFYCLSFPALSAGLLNSNESTNTSEQQPAFVDMIDTEAMDRTNQAMLQLRTLNSTQAVFDTSKPNDNTLVVNHNPLGTIKLRVREMMGTLIVLPEHDAIKHVKLGDTTNFTFKTRDGEFENDYPRTGTLDVELAGADTSLHIIGTSGNIYTFYARGDTWDSKEAPTLKVLIKDENMVKRLEAKKRRKEKAAKLALLEKQKLEALEKAQTKQAVEKSKGKKPVVQSDFLQDVPFDPSKLNFAYRIRSGDNELRPYMAYDDGIFTYFRFAKVDDVANVTSLPVVYRVEDGSDVPTNVSANNATLRVESISNMWTLRLGDKYLCIERIDKIPTNYTSMNSTVKTLDNKPKEQKKKKIRYNRK